MAISLGTTIRGKHRPHATYKVIAVYPLSESYVTLKVQRILRTGSTAFRPKFIPMRSTLSCPILFELVNPPCRSKAGDRLQPLANQDRR